MEEQIARLEITIVGARGLPGKPSSYCTCEVQRHPETKVQTGIAGNTSCPTWNHYCEIAEYTPHDALEFGVCSKGPTEDGENLGKVILAHDHFYPGGFDGEVALGDRSPTTKITVKIKVFILSRITVTIVGASGLQSPEKSFHPSSYCVCEVPRKALFCKTSTLPDSPSPMWNHEHEFSNYCAGDSLEFSVWNQGAAEDDLLGTATLSYARFEANGFEGLLRLMKSGKKSEAEIMVDVKVIRLGTPVPLKVNARMEVLIFGASGLETKAARKLDPYCMCELPGEEIIRFQTPVVNNTSSPKWNHLHEVAEYAPEAPLQLHVFHYNGTGSDELLGTAALSHKQFYPDGFEGTLELGAAESNVEECKVKGTLSLRIRMFLKSLIEVTIVRADGLRKEDTFGYQEVYCVCAASGKRGLQLQTPAIKERGSPVWNYVRELNYSAGTPLEISIWDKIPSGDDLVGVATLLPSQFVKGVFDGPLRLSKAGKNLDATVTLRIKTLQAGVPEVRKAPVRVSVVSAQSLRKVDASELSSIFCVCEIVGRRNTEFKTSAVYCTSSPTWNELYDFKEYLVGDSFLFSVWGKARGEEVLLGKSLVVHDTFFPNGFSGKVSLELDAQKDQGLLMLSIRALQNTDAALVNRRSNVGELFVGGRPPQQRFLAQLKRESPGDPWGLSLAGPYLYIAGISQKSPAATWDQGDGQGSLRHGDVVLQINGKTGGSVAASAELSRQRQVLDLLVERTKTKDAETQVDPNMLGNCDVGVQAAGKLLEIGEAHFAAELPLAAAHMELQREERITKREEVLKLECGLLEKENIRLDAELRRLTRTMEADRKKAEESLARKEEALTRYRLAQQPRKYAVEPVAEMVMGPVQPHPGPLASLPPVPRKLPEGAEQDDMAFSGQHAPRDASVIDLRREVLRLEGRLIELRRSTTSTINALETAASLPSDGFRNAQPTKGKVLSFPGESSTASDPMYSSPRARTTPGVGDSKLPQPISFHEVLQRLYRSQELYGIEDWEAPDDTSQHQYSSGMKWESAGDRLQQFYKDSSGNSSDTRHDTQDY